MAKSGKIKRERLKDISPGGGKRTPGNREVRQYYLISCEGEETERLYFNALKNELPPNMISVEQVGEGKNTKSLLSKTERRVSARERDKSKPDYDRVWIVFDKDGFPDDDFDNTVSLIQSKNKQDSRIIWNAAWSNESFELWFLFHYQTISDSSKSRKDYKEMLERHLKKKYRKNDENMYEILKDKTETAVKNAENALSFFSANTPLHARNPATTVHELVKELLAFKE